MSFDSADREISVFEITIRALGGLLGAHALTGRRAFLERAEELGRRLLPALNTTSGLPRPRWNIARQGARATNEPTILAEAGSLQLEFRYLSALPVRSWGFPPCGPAPAASPVPPPSAVVKAARSTTYSLPGAVVPPP